MTPSKIALLAAAGVFASACYTTRIRAGIPSGKTYERRQWFTLAGGASLSDPAGEECGERGVAEADSRLAGGDILINAGLFIAGGIIGAAACPLDDDPSRDQAVSYGSCFSATASLVPFFLGSRTVTYRCR